MAIDASFIKPRQTCAPMQGTRSIAPRMLSPLARVSEVLLWMLIPAEWAGAEEHMAEKMKP